MSRLPSFEPIAIIGIGAIFPGSDNAHSFWRAIINGVDLITEVPETHWLVADYYDPDPKAIDKTYCKRGAFISPVDFNPVEYGIPPANVPQTDTTQLLTLMATKQLLVDAFGEDFDTTTDLSKANVILGVTSAQELVIEASARLQHPVWRKALREAGIPGDIEEQICQRVSNSYVPWSESMFPGLLGNVVSGRVANRFNFGGTNCVTDAACASSMAALSMAVDELHLGRADLAVAGGADTLNDIFMYMCFSKTPALSKSGDCRPFAKSADGTILGEGIGLIAMKRLSDAERDGDAIYAVIRGIGSSSDGRSKSVYAPDAQGQAVAIQRSYTAAEFSADTIGLIEAHGTGTIAGDAAEVAGLKLGFGSAENKTPWCALGSIKSQIGHTKAAAGAAALIKTIMALRHKVLPPTIKVDEPNPKLEINHSPFYLNTQARPWIGTANHHRRAGVSSFGFGGTNFHVALEEYAGLGKAASRVRSFPTELILLSADSPQTLLALIGQVKQAALSYSLLYLAKWSQQAFVATQPARLAVVASDIADLNHKLTLVSEQITKSLQPYSQKDIYYSFGNESGKIAFLFPGQGAQYTNMGADLLMAFDQMQGLWSEANDIQLDSTPLSEIVFPVPVFNSEAERAQQEQLAQTHWTQPALAVTSLLYLQLLAGLGLKADVYAGHSFGELVALHAAGVFNKTDLIRIARKRGELMTQAGSIPGAMTAVIYPDVNKLLQQIKLWQIAVVPANFNSPEQTVFSGAKTAIEALEAQLKNERISFRRLPVSTAFHSHIIEQSRQPFLDYLKTVTMYKPSQTVYANSTAAVLQPEDVNEIRYYLAEQLLNPVQFVAQIQAMYASGVRTFVEVGPQSILTHLVNKILAGKEFKAIAVDDKQENGITALWRALGQLAVNGIALNFTALWQEYAEPAKPKDNGAKNFMLSISGTNYGKPYPPPGGVDNLPRPNPVSHAPDWLKEDIEHSSVTQERIKPMLHNKPNESSFSGGGEQSSIHKNETMEKILVLYQKLQEDVTKAHLEYQTLTEKSHLAYLDEVKTALDDIRMLALEVEAADHVDHSHANRVGHALASIQGKLEVVAQNALPTQTAAPASVQIDSPIVVPVAQKMAPPPIAAPVIAQPKLEIATVVVPSDMGIDSATEATILAIVADKTGYPQDTLSMDMDLEADLGIDSIKRVEILSALQEQIPNLPELNPAELATLRTFGEIALYIKKQQGV